LHDVVFLMTIVQEIATVITAGRGNSALAQGSVAASLAVGSLPSHRKRGPLEFSTRTNRIRE
jgi:hypothetical protein